jgi:hypothetical protein
MSPPDLHVTRPGPSSCTSYTESIQPLSCSQAYSPCIHTHIGSTLGVVIPVPRRPGATAASYPTFPPRVSTSSGWDHLRAPCTRNLSNRCHVPKHIPVLIHTLVPIVGWLSPYQDARALTAASYSTNVLPGSSRHPAGTIYQCPSCIQHLIRDNCFDRSGFPTPWASVLTSRTPAVATCTSKSLAFIRTGSPRVVTTLFQSSSKSFLYPTPHSGQLFRPVGISHPVGKCADVQNTRRRHVYEYSLSHSYAPVLQEWLPPFSNPPPSLRNPHSRFM